MVRIDLIARHKTRIQAEPVPRTVMENRRTTYERGPGTGRQRNVVKILAFVAISKARRQREAVDRAVVDVSIARRRLVALGPNGQLIDLLGKSFPRSNAV